MSSSLERALRAAERAAGRDLWHRCDWCSVKLRWWQGGYCRACYVPLRDNHPSPPCLPRSRFDAAPDRLLNRPA